MGSKSGGGAWLAFRVFLAIGLTFLFYAVALGLAVGLLLVAWFAVREADSFPVRLLLFCLVGAGGILYATFPRPDRFLPPGPRLLEKDHPRLFGVLRALAKAVGQELPTEVYLASDVNAGVLQRGGTLGFGGRRVMILGLPLMAALRVSEFRGVLAHEFGHYQGGETGFGPWIYRTQEAIGRTVRTLSEAGSLLRFLFLWYGKAFLRITQAVSRRQELAADRLAAEVAGAAAIAGGLRSIHGAAAAYDAYFGSEFLPVFSAGFLPPMAEGFQSFLRVGDVSASVERLVEEEALHGKGDPYDSHPPLGVRLAALGNPPPQPPSAGDPPAASLLEGMEDLERRLFESVFPGKKAPPGVRWKEAGEKAFVPRWRTEVARDRALLHGLTPAGLPDLLSRPAGDPRWKRRGAAAPPPDGPPRAAVVAGMAMILHLVERGWAVESEPGKAVVVLRDGESFHPFREIEDLRTGNTTREGWVERCRGLGVLDLALEEVARVEGGSP